MANSEETSFLPFELGECCHPSIAKDEETFGLEISLESVHTSLSGPPLQSMSFKPDSTTRGGGSPKPPAASETPRITASVSSLHLET